MELIKRIFKSRLPVAWVMVGVLLFFMSSCSTHQEFTSSDESEECNNYSSYEEKLLTSETSLEQKIEFVAESTPRTEEKKRHYEYTNADVDMLARLVLREAGGCAEDEQRLIVWTVFQRVDSTDWDFRNMNTIADVVTAPHQFAYYESSPIKDEIRKLCETELEKWATGGTPPTVEPYAPTLPYLFFEGDGRHNWFRAEW